MPEADLPTDPNRPPLASFGVMDLSPDPALDGLVRLAAQCCDAAMALVTLVDGDRQIVLARHGDDDGLRVRGLEIGFCPLVVATEAELVIPDSAADPRHAGNPAFTAHGIRFYAGVPLRDADGHVPGTLCVLDRSPRPEGLPPPRRDMLHALALQVASRFALRRSVLERDLLLRSERRFRALFDTLDDGFCVIQFIDGPHGPDSDYLHVEANAGYERHTGIRGVVGRTLRQIAPGEEAGWLSLYGGVLRTGRPLRFERAFAAVERVIEVSAARLDPPELRQVSVMFRDITARRRAETLARENIERVQLALAAGAIMGTWVWDLRQNRIAPDEALAGAIGLDAAVGPAGVALDRLLNAVHPDDRDAVTAALDPALAGAGGYLCRFRVRRAAGYGWVEASGRVARDGDGTATSLPAVVIDVEQRRAVEAERDRATAALRALNETLEQRIAERTAELLRAEEQLRQSQKMEAVGQLTGGIAHDFNNLLTGISGSLELLGTRIRQNRLGEAERYVSAAQDAARRAASLTHRLLAFSRRQTLDPRPTDANRLVAEMAELIRRTAGPSIAVVADRTPELWPILVDPPQLENALLNLCINARDAMPNGGTLSVRAENRWLDPDEARGLDLPPGPFVSLSVCDSGVGMTPEVIGKAFDPFFTTKPLGQGTGLGLSMIYGFVRQSGGQARIRSAPGEGTAVQLLLPRHDGAVAGPVPDPGDPDALPRAAPGETVLVVDDEPTLRMLVIEVLGELGYTALEAGTGAEGLSILRTPPDRLSIDLLLTDVGLPGGMNGRQMADAARVVRPGLKTLFITGFAEAAVIDAGRLEPGMHVMTKPFTLQDLAGRIRELIRA